MHICDYDYATSCIEVCLSKTKYRRNLHKSFLLCTRSKFYLCAIKRFITLSEAVEPNQLSCSVALLLSGFSRSEINHIAMDSVNLTALPEDVLVKIISLISEAKPCFESPDDFRVTCDATTWRNLNALRSTCRALRRACSQAVVGLRDIEIAEQWRRPREDEMDFDTAISFPCLFELNEVRGGGVRDLIRLRRDLRHVTFDGKTEAKWSLCCWLVSSGCENLETVNLTNVRDGPANLLLGCLKNLWQLRIEGCNEIEMINEEAVSKVGYVTLCRCKDISALLECFALAPMLFEMDAKMSYFSQESFKKFVDNTVVECFRFTVDSREDDTNSCALLRQALLDGALGELEELHLNTHSMSDPHILVQNLPRICTDLDKIELDVFHGLNIDWIHPIAHIDFGEDCEVRLILREKGTILKDLSVRSLLPLKNLTSLYILFYGDIEDIVYLANFPKLRIIHLTCCVYYKSVVKLAHSLKASTDLTLDECYYVGDDSQRILNYENKWGVSRDDILNGLIVPPLPTSIPAPLFVP